MSPKKMTSSALILVLLSAIRLFGREASDTKPTEVTISELGLNPEKFDGQLVRVQAVLVSGWEGDRFLSDPNPQNMPNGRPAYLWLYLTPQHERQLGGQMGYGGNVYGLFTGYFHFVAAPWNNGMFDPGHLQFEAIEMASLGEPHTLASAIRNGNLQEVRRILRSGARLNILDEYQDLPLFEAISSRHPDIAQELLAAGADPKLLQSDGSTTLMMAAWVDDPETAKLLLDRGVPVDAKDAIGQTALCRAFHKGSDGKTVQLLLDVGADPNANGGWPLIGAAMAGDALAAEKLLKAGANPAAKDIYGNTAEDEACDRGEKGHYQVCLLVREALKKK